METQDTKDTIFDKISGIEILNPFKYHAEFPLDARLVVDTSEELTKLASENGAYDGMLVYVKTDRGYYTYDGENKSWSKFTADVAGLTEKRLKKIISFMDTYVELDEDE